jgi:hypothetical protein
MPLKTSLIRQRIADFLKFHRPFEFFSETDQLALASPAEDNCIAIRYFFQV